MNLKINSLKSAQSHQHKFLLNFKVSLLCMCHSAMKTWHCITTGSMQCDKNSGNSVEGHNALQVRATLRVNRV